MITSLLCGGQSLRPPENTIITVEMVIVELLVHLVEEVEIRVGGCFTPDKIQNEYYKNRRLKKALH